MRIFFRFLFIIGILYTTSSFILPVTPACSNIRNGKFYYYTKNSREKIEIERHDSLQLETNKANGHVLRCKIIWKDECGYDMYVNALSYVKLQGMEAVLAATPVNVDIVKVEKTFYICHWDVKFGGKEMQERDTMYFDSKIDNY